MAERAVATRKTVARNFLRTRRCPESSRRAEGRRFELATFAAWVIRHFHDRLRREWTEWKTRVQPSHVIERGPSEREVLKRHRSGVVLRCTPVRVPAVDEGDIRGASRRIARIRLVGSEANHDDSTHKRGDGQRRPHLGRRPGQYRQCSAPAHARICRLPPVSSFEWISLRWNRTAFFVIPSSAAMALFVRPDAARSSTSCSRGVSSGPGSGSPGFISSPHSSASSWNETSPGD